MKDEKELKDMVEREELLYQIALFCIERNCVSIITIQINFGIGFNQTANMIEELEKRGVISPKNGTQGRKILVDKEKLKKVFALILTK